ncbi:ras family-domain-containing protein [Anaeramoeba ignava]|uniref:Ras family-domain-containing protein n=1 Tax=Anaeramoeba ignava TaxID=1746090 RepID=A0A9Q0LJ17_ANAIG|nr:ras family-domain-containing protein [Anaeramoeba ignava]
MSYDVADLKIVILGSSLVGKTTLITRIVEGQFVDPETTIGASTLLKKYQGMYDSEYTFAIWDTAGQERFDSLAPAYCRGAGCALIVYSLIDRNSFSRLDHYIKMLENANVDRFVILVGTKLDLVQENSKLRKVSLEEGEKKAHQLKAQFFEVSSKTGENVNSIWTTIGKFYERSLIDRGKKLEIDEIENPKNKPKNVDHIKIVDVSLTSKKPQKGCCKN